MQIISFVVIYLINFYFYFFSDQIYEDSFIRLLFGGVFIFLFPGMLFGEIIKIKSKHFFSYIAWSFALTLSIQLPVIVFSLFFKIYMSHLINLLFIIIAIEIVYIFIKIKDTKFIGNSLNHSVFYQSSSYIFLFFICILVYGTYNWGTSLNYSIYKQDIASEHFQHISYTRYYQDMRLELHNLSTIKGVVPANIIRGWEFFLAEIGKLTKMEPFHVYFRIRFWIPILGFSIFYLILNLIFQNKNKILYMMIFIFILGFGKFLYFDNYISWLTFEDRGVGHFFGIAHHTDVAYDIIFPVSLFSLVYLYRIKKITFIKIIFIFELLIISFMWHPRMFFMTEYFFGVAFLVNIVIKIFHSKKNTLLNKSYYFLFIIIFVNLFFLIAYKLNETSLTIVYNANDEWAIKQNFIIELINEKWKEFHHIFYFFGAFKLWLLVGTISIVILLWLGNKLEKLLCVYIVVHYGLLAVWGGGVNILATLTYSEIHMGLASMYYYPVLILISNSFYLIYLRMIHSQKKILSLFILLLVGGILKFLWGIKNMPIDILAYFVTAIILYLLIINLFSFVQKKTILGIYFFQLSKQQLSISNKQNNIFVFILFSLFFLFPIIGTNIKTIVSQILYYERSSFDCYYQKDFGMSKELVRALRNKIIPIGSLVYNDPMSRYPLRLYIPIYTTVGVPIASIMDQEVNAKAQKDEFILFNSKMESSKHIEVISHLKNLKVDYISVEENYYGRLKNYFVLFSNDYSIVFDNPLKKELIIKVIYE